MHMVRIRQKRAVQERGWGEERACRRQAQLLLASAPWEPTRSTCLSWRYENGQKSSLTNVMEKAIR